MAKRHASRGPGWSPNFVSDRDALARLMEAEAGGEGDAGKLAVANVVRNRADSNYSGYGRDITSQVRARSQFSAFNPHGSVNATGKRTMAMPAAGETMRHNYELADRVLARMEPDPTHGANQYYAPQGMPGHRAPRWWNDQYKTAEIGHQKFQSNPASPVTPDTGHVAIGDQAQLAARGDKGGAADVLTAALDRAQRTQPADNRPVWAKTQADQVARSNTSPTSPEPQQARSGQYAPPPPGSVLNRINPNDRSGPLLPEPGAAPQRQMADVKPNDFGRGIPASRMETPGVGQRLDPSPSIQTARQYAPPPPGSVLNRINPNDRSGPLLPEGGASRQMADVRPNDFGRGIPPSQMQTPGVGQWLDPMTERQIADAGPNDFGRGMPASRMETPGVGQRLDITPPRQMADVRPNDFGRGIPSNGMQTPGVGQRLDSTPPTQMAQVGPNDFGRGIPASTMETPGVGQRLDPSPSIQTARTFDAPPPGSVLNRLNPADPSGPLLPGAGAPPTQMAQVGPNDFGRGIPVNGMQTPGVGMMLEQMPPTQMADAGPYDFGRGISANGMQTPGVGMALEQMPPAQIALLPPVPAPPNPPMFSGGYGDSSLKQQLDAQWENRTPYTPHMQQTPQTPQTLPESPTSAPTPPTPMGEASGPGPTPSAPMPPQRPTHFGGAPIRTASLSPGPTRAPEPMLFEPQGGGGGTEGMAGPAQVAPEFMSANPMAGGQQGFDPFSGLGGLFADAFSPVDGQGAQFADAGPDLFGGGDFGGGFGGGGFDLGSLFG